MVKKIILIYAVLNLSALYSRAQISGSINGVVMDESKRPIYPVTVFIIIVKDSTLVVAGTTDSLGRYSLPLSTKGYFLLHFSMIGYNEKFSGPFYFSGNQYMNQSAIILKAISNKLSEVSVTAKKSLVENQEGKTIYNVESSINSTGSTALEILKKTSGLQVNNSEDISLKGKNGVRIYIDGQELPFDNSSLIAYLNTINSNDIKSIEVITNPNATYDAGGSAGIINIHLKKNQIYGTNGDISLGCIQGITPKGNAALNLNYRDKKLNLFGSFSGNLGQSQTQFNLSRIQLDTLYDQKTLIHNHNNGFNSKVGLDYILNPRNIIGVMATYGYTNALYTSAANTPIYSNAGKSFVHEVQSNDYAPGSIINDNFNVNYRYSDTLGDEINFDANYSHFNHSSNGYLPDYYYDQFENFLYSIINWNEAPTTIDIYSSKVDFIRNLWKGKLSYGVKTSFIETDNTYNFYVSDSNGKPVRVLNASSQFLYMENINAVYLHYQYPFKKKWLIVAGLRVEQTNSVGQLYKADSMGYNNTVKHLYTDLFPDASITWNKNDNINFNLSYNRRIDRPVYQDLNPFELKLDEFTYFRGNEFLQPQITNQVTISNQLFKKINISLFYSATTNLAKRVSDTLGNEIYAQVRNIGTLKNIGLNMNSSFTVSKGWQSFQSFWYDFQMFDVTVDGIHIKTNIPAYGMNIAESFDIKNGYSAELTGWFNGPNSDNAIWMVKSMGGIDVGIKKMLLNNSLTIKLNATDIFHTNKLYVYGHFQGVIGTGSFIPETQTARINVSWRFGSKQIKAKRDRNTGLENETQRIKTQ